VVCPSSFGHCVVCPSSFGHCVVCSSVFWPLCGLFFCLLAIVWSVRLRFTGSDYPIGILSLFLLIILWISLYLIEHIRNVWILRSQNERYAQIGLHKIKICIPCVYLVR
jgi:hypothetical protein